MGFPNFWSQSLIHRFKKKTSPHPWNSKGSQHSSNHRWKPRHREGQHGAAQKLRAHRGGPHLIWAASMLKTHKNMEMKSGSIQYSHPQLIKCWCHHSSWLKLFSSTVYMRFPTPRKIDVSTFSLMNPLPTFRGEKAFCLNSQVWKVRLADSWEASGDQRWWWKVWVSATFEIDGNSIEGLLKGEGKSTKNYIYTLPKTSSHLKLGWLLQMMHVPFVDKRPARLVSGFVFLSYGNN